MGVHAGQPPKRTVQLQADVVMGQSGWSPRRGFPGRSVHHVSSSWQEHLPDNRRQIPSVCCTLKGCAAAPPRPAHPVPGQHTTWAGPAFPCRASGLPSSTCPGEPPALWQTSCEVLYEELCRFQHRSQQMWVWSRPGRKGTWEKAKQGAGGDRERSCCCLLGTHFQLCPRFSAQTL